MSGFLMANRCDRPDPPGEGVLLITVATSDVSGTALEGLYSLHGTSMRTEIIHQTECDPLYESRLTTTEEPVELEITTEAPNIPRLIAKLNVPIGCVAQIRFVTDDIVAVIDGEEIPVRVPSGPQTGLKVVPIDGEPPFPIFEGQTTAIRIDYNPNSKLVVNRGQGIIEKPVLEAHVVDEENAVGFVLDEIVVTFEPGTSQEDIEASVAGVSGEIVDQYPDHYVTVKLPNTDSMRSAIEYFDGEGSVLVALPNSLVPFAELNPFPEPDEPDDPFWDDPLRPAFGWGLERVNLNRVSALDAWRITTSDSSVVIGIVDSGFEMLHEDLIDNIWINEDEIPEGVRDRIVHVDTDGVLTFVDLADPRNCVAGGGVCPCDVSPPLDRCDPLDIVDGDCSGRNSCTAINEWQNGDDTDGNGFADDIFGWDFRGNDNLPLPRADSVHGTGVAGIAGGKGNNGITSLGIAWNARLMLIRVDTRDPGETSFRDSVIHGLHYALQNDAQVVNASLGSVFALRNSPSELTHESSCGLYVDNSIPPDKWDETVERVRNEWLEAMHDVDPASAVITVPLPNCRVNMDQADEIFIWPAVLGASRGDLGQPEPIAPTLIGVANAEIWQRLTNEERGFPDICSFYCGYGVQTAQIAAPGMGWRLLSPRPDGVEGLYAGYVYCSEDEDYPRCEGASLSAPQVAATAAMIFSYSNEYALGLTPLDVKQRILDNATYHLALDGLVGGGRFLDVHLAVTGGL
jgi:subtilisin family serine protease